MSTKHTPGPWTALEGIRDSFDLPQYQRKDRSYVVLDERRLPIAEIRMGNPSANARLIAAAPELLEACQDMQFAIESAKDDLYENAFRGLKAAIAKATDGERGN